MKFLAILSALTVLFVTHTAQAETFTGCLKTDGIIENVAIGTLPLKPCKGKALQISWSSEDTLGGLSCQDSDVAVFDSGVWVCHSDLPRFVDNGDGTITDNDTGLMWEKKTGSIFSTIFCDTPNSCPDPHSVNNVYRWTASGTAPDGTLYTNFLAKLNLDATDDRGGTCFANHCDWRVPNIVELPSILLPPYPSCVSPPCIDPIFGPTQVANYWTSSSGASFPDNAWIVDFNFGLVNPANKVDNTYVRAVRNAW